MPHHLFNWDSIGIEPNKLEGQGQQILDLPFGWPVKRWNVLFCLSTCFDFQAMLFLRLLRLAAWDRNFINTNAFAKNIIIIEMLRHHKSEIGGHIMTKLALTPFISNSADPAAITAASTLQPQPSLALLSAAVTLLLSHRHSTAVTLHSICSRHTGAYNSFVQRIHILISLPSVWAFGNFYFIPPSSSYMLTSGKWKASHWASICCHLTGQHTE